MKKLHFLAMAVIACVMTSCFFKTEATIDVQVIKPDKQNAGPGLQVYMFDDSGYDTGYKTNAKRSVATDAAGVAHFEIKSPDDIVPSGTGYDEQVTFIFCTYDKQDRRNGSTSVTVVPGNKKTATINQETIPDE